MVRMRMYLHPSRFPTPFVLPCPSTLHVWGRVRRRWSSNEAAPSLMKFNFCLPHETIYKDKEVEQVRFCTVLTASSLDTRRAPWWDGRDAGSKELAHQAPFKRSIAMTKDVRPERVRDACFEIFRHLRPRVP